MNQPLDSNPTKFEVRVNGRTVGNATSRAAADLILSQLTESERQVAQIVPVASNGNAVLLG